MTLYWPSAKFRDSTGNITKISTSNGTFSLEEAQNQLNIWRDNYGMAVTDFWIDVYSGSGCDRIEMEDENE